MAMKGSLEIKIGPNYVLRGALFTPEVKTISTDAKKEFEKSVSVQCLSIADTYGGKICAALDRQHPRDLFDIKFLFENEGINEDIKDSFIYYLISHNRPIDELLEPNLKDIRDQYKSEFLEMVLEDVSVEELEAIREELIKAINSSLRIDDKKFLMSFLNNSPEWSLLRDEKIKDYPSVRWKLFNQEKMTLTKKTEYRKKLEKIFSR